MDLKNHFAFCQYFSRRQKKTKEGRGVVIRRQPRRPIKRIFLKHAAAS